VMCKQAVPQFLVLCVWLGAGESFYFISYSFSFHSYVEVRRTRRNEGKHVCKTGSREREENLPTLMDNEQRKRTDS
jgi:hypothetical protein